MSESKHTPGPFKGISRHNGTVNIESSAGAVLGVAMKTDRLTFEEVRFNAKLWAASPDLLETCQMAADAIAAMRDGIPATIGQLETLSNTCQAAIAKATGEEVGS